MDTVSKVIFIIEDQVFAPVVPNGFSPNEDATNDVLYVRGGPFLELDFKVYNEWGNLVFETQDASQGWDGTKNGSYQPLGTYTYTVSATTVDGKSYKRSGDLTLIR